MSKLAFTKKNNLTRCKNSAIYSLAMREHSRLEIFNKLSKKEIAEGVDLEQLLDELEEKDYLNEERFVESFIRYRVTRGQGSIKISNELRQRGISGAMISQFLQEADVDWIETASNELEKKFGLTHSFDYKEKAKRMRFLYNRGFSQDIISQVIY